MQRDLHSRNSHEEEGDQHAEQTHRGALSTVIEAKRASARARLPPLVCGLIQSQTGQYTKYTQTTRKYCMPMES